MTVKMHGTYLGNKKLRLVHDSSGAAFTTAAPLDNNGDGSSFSPTDLFAVSLGACTLTVISIVAERDGTDLSGSHFTVEKQMNSNPRRVGQITVVVHLPMHLDEQQRKKLEHTGATCPVHRSLHPDVIADVTYVYDVAPQ